MIRSIAKLLNEPANSRGISWLTESLQVAAQIELTTIPPYLCAIWSIRRRTEPVYELIRDIAIEEMLHLSLVANLSASLGGHVKLTGDRAPAYPTSLPAGIASGLVVELQGLSKAALRTFMEIEKPSFPPVAFELMERATIGDFYAAIRSDLEKLPDDAFQTDGQIELDFPIGNDEGEYPTIIDNRATALKAIAVIVEQGEGSPQDPFSDDGGSPPNEKELAHYYRFAEILKGRKLIQRSDGTYAYEGGVIEMPEVLPVGKVPPEGYPDHLEIVEFNSYYSSILTGIERAWETVDQALLKTSFRAMHDLTDKGRRIMQIDRGDGQRLCPDFRFQ